MFQKIKTYVILEIYIFFKSIDPNLKSEIAKFTKITV